MTTETSKQRHTPGPWSLFRIDGGWHVNQSGGPVFIGTLPRYPLREQECDANARLIAAAPDLLRAARRAVCTLAAHHQFTQEYEELDAAIKKATT
jgi:hypothetical protein